MLLRSAGFLLSLWAVVFVIGCARGGEGDVDRGPFGDFGDGDASVDGPPWGGPDASIGDDDDGGGLPTCTPNTCESFDAECGYIADGCGEVVFCGDCQGEGESCGGNGIANKCGGPCVPLTCDDLGVGCGIHGDGCGGSLDCGSCAEGEFCGGGGPNACGPAPVPVECMTKEQACDEAGLDCGWVSDGCGGVVDCGSCPLGTLCGGAGVHNVCGVAPVVDGGSACPALTEAEACAGKDCGQQSDGCGGVIDCGSCPAGSICGVGGPSLCGAPPCTKIPEAVACAGKSCGEVGDGCGGTWNCGSCTGGESCGGGGVPFQCGKPHSCQPKTCAELGFNCGKATDGCGGIIDCGPIDCGPGMVCGGDGPNRCGSGGVGSSDPCPSGTTTISGKVYMPNATVPVQGALVYVPKSLDDIPTFPNTVSCERCDSQIPPSAIAHAVSGIDGSFTLKGVPAGNVPVVIQVGRFRRKIDVPVTACQNVALSAEQTRLPRRHNEANAYDHIPKIAVVTGLVDAMECVLRRMGIADDQFSKPAGGKRIHIVQADSYGGGRGPRLNPSDFSQPRGAEIYGNQATLDTYDMVLLACQSMAITKNDADIDRLVAYANKGGRIFATHYSYTWLSKRDPFRTTATWSGNTTAFGPNVGTVDTSFAKGQAFAEWLRHVGAGFGPPGVTQIQIAEPRGSVSAVASTARRWITATLGGTNYVQHYTFNTPVGAADDQQCGRVVFSDFHVSGGDSLSSKNFPEQCANRTELSAEEKALAFMILDLAACIQSDDEEPTCQPKTCEDLGLECGPAGDGCGNIIPSCGTCPGDLTCGGGGVPGQCGKQECEKQSCASQGIFCGPASDGCGNLLHCGDCDEGEVCGGGGIPGQCGTPACSPVSCEDQGIECGPAGDGCGGLIPSCGSCPPGLTCGGGGVPGRCGYSDASACEPASCAELGVECGPIGDGCGGLIECGDCSEKPGTTCGGGGFPGQCGSPCVPKSCDDLGIECGPAGDGCGGVLECGDCENGQSCGGGGVPGKCGGGQCIPKTCEDFGYECGPAADGCGALLDCGSCPAPTYCGGGGPGKCGGVR